MEYSQQAWTRKYQMVSDLQVERYPRGEITRLNLVLTHNSLGRELCVPVIVARGLKSGPIFGLTAAVHGNEVNGIPVIHRLINGLDLNKLKGTVVAVPVVNVPGLIQGQRAFNDGVDLNTIMPGSPNGRDSQVYAHRFSERIVARLNYLVDLHTASFGRINSLYVRGDMTMEITAGMARQIRPQIILHNKAGDGTLRGHAMSLGIPSITIEVGNPYRFQAEYIKRTIAGIRAMMEQFGLLPKRTRTKQPPPVICKRSFWMYTDQGGLLEVMPDLTDRVEKGQKIAQLSDIFGKPLVDYIAREAGVVIGKSVHPVGQTGARILHLGIPAENDHDFAGEAESASS